MLCAWSVRPASADRGRRLSAPASLCRSGAGGKGRGADAPGGAAGRAPERSRLPSPVIEPVRPSCRAASGRRGAAREPVGTGSAGSPLSRLGPPRAASGGKDPDAARQSRSRAGGTAVARGGSEPDVGTLQPAETGGAGWE
ncbi:hypothetical protein GCM10009601_37040 [Streptomyces thermospinosisporus]|uniref:Uncharacterized protein n=1 Tax=Streptomyces thermospinosisporus TaxID=161482 RepID=A0ABN1Z100_9ACTN